MNLSLAENKIGQLDRKFKFFVYWDHIFYLERAKIGNSDRTTPNTVQDHEILRFRRGKLHRTRWNKQSYQSFSNSLFVVAPLLQ